MEEQTEEIKEEKIIPRVGNLTNLKDTDLLIFEQLQDKDLLQLCMINKAINRTCSDETFWRKRFIKNFDNMDKEIILEGFSNIPSKYKRPEETWKNFYLKFVYYINKYTVSPHLVKQAAFKGHMSLVVYAINTMKQKGSPLTHSAVLIIANQGGYYDIIKYLILNGAAQEQLTESILVWNVAYGNEDIVKFLVEHGAIVSRADNAALRWAAKVNKFNIVKYLVEKGAEIHAKNEEPLQWAARNGNLEMLSYLIDQGAVFSINNELALRWAITNDHYHIVEYLIQLGANVNAVSDKGETPLKTAKKYNDPKMVNLLISHGAKE